MIRIMVNKVNHSILTLFFAIYFRQNTIIGIIFIEVFIEVQNQFHNFALRKSLESSKNIIF